MYTHMYNYMYVYIYIYISISTPLWTRQGLQQRAHDPVRAHGLGGTQQQGQHQQVQLGVVGPQQALLAQGAHDLVRAHALGHQV